MAMWERAKIAGKIARENSMGRFEPGALNRWLKIIQRNLEKQKNLQLLEYGRMVIVVKRLTSDLDHIY